MPGQRATGEAEEQKLFRLGEPQGEKSYQAEKVPKHCPLWRRVWKNWVSNTPSYKLDQPL